MAGRYLLDTSIIIALFAGDTAVQAGLDRADEVFVPSIALGELYYGAHKSARVGENLARVDEFALNSAVLGADVEVARRYGAIKDGLRARGRPIPENDLWIAAIAREHELTLVSRDAHLAQVEGLPVESW
jgi:tRNA(fMet)-specific endonuclease VapC